MRESPAWPRITLGGGVERSRATDAASSEAIGTPAEPLGLLSRVATGPLHGGRATQRGLTGHYVINAVGKFNAQRRHRIDPVKGLCVAAAPAAWRYWLRFAAPRLW